MKIQQENVDSTELQQSATKVKKAKKVKEPRDIRYMFRKTLKEIDIAKLKKPWMAKKAFRIINTPAALQAWVDSVLSDTSRHIMINDVLTPVVALDTETMGLDTRILVDRVQRTDGSWENIYEVNIELAGICLSSDGVEGIYIPVNHEKQDRELTIPAINIDRAECARILQILFDRSHLIFYNAKYDREVMRLTMGINFRPYPHFEDVQVLAYINDPKADLGDKGRFTGEAGGLKALSKNVLGIEQIELDEIAKVKADYCPLTGGPFCACTAEQRKENKHTQKNHFAPFNWIPTDIALWYAAGDAICTWLLWKLMYELARSRKLIHRIDHELVESITWIERQRWVVDTSRLGRTVKGHQKKIGELREKLRQLAVEAGYEERATDDGIVSDEDKFNPGSTMQLQQLLYKVKGYEVKKFTGAGNPSCDAEVLEDLFKAHPEDKFLETITTYRDYMALHPDNLRFDPRDHTARIYLKQNVVAGGRLAAAGGDFEKDGGFGLNPQGIKKVESYLMWKVTGNVLDPDEIPVDQIEGYAEEDLHPSCFRDKDGVKSKAPGIINNHIGQYLGYAICLVPKCTSCAEKFGILIENGKMDANEMINLRVLFCAPPGWTLFSVDYGNIEMRCAANVSGEPEFIKEFLEGKGDFHSLTASKVFPEFNDPATTKAVRKSLRELAKIINFALLYGGTEYTIFENMKKKKPDITWEEAKTMVAKYWEGVPVFFQFCQMKQEIAKNEMLCKTATGRVISFQSAMEAQHIHKPDEEEMDAYWDYRKLMKKAEAAKREDDLEKSAKLRAMADRMWKNPETGVRNAMDYNKFMGKIQRVSVNVPLQGLAGDFMRMSLNRIRKWVESDPLIQSVLHLHCSVHDEIDFIVKNEYAPFVLPRITRLMKLRKLHEKMNWKVPIEADAEYGRSWDVEHHLTGDDDHKPAAWTEIEGMANYIPEGWDSATIKQLIKAVGAGESHAAKVRTFLQENLQPRAFLAAKPFFEAKDDKARKKALIAAIQLDEFWRIDGVPDDEDDKLESIESYEKRNELGPDSRDPYTPDFGYLGAIPLTANVKRPTIEILGEERSPEEVDIVVSEEEITVSVEDEGAEVESDAGENTVIEEPPPQTMAMAAHAAAQDLKASLKAPTPSEDSVFAETPVPRPKKVVETVAVEVPDDGQPTYELIDLNEGPGLQLRVLLGKGSNTIRVLYRGKIAYFRDKALNHIPEEFVKKVYGVTV